MWNVTESVHTRILQQSWAYTQLDKPLPCEENVPLECIDPVSSRWQVGLHEGACQSLHAAMVANWTLGVHLLAWEQHPAFSRKYFNFWRTSTTPHGETDLIKGAVIILYYLVIITINYWMYLLWRITNMWWLKKRTLFCLFNNSWLKFT